MVVRLAKTALIHLTGTGLVARTKNDSRWMTVVLCNVCCAVAYYSRLYLTGKASPGVNLGTLYIPQFLNVATTIE